MTTRLVRPSQDASLANHETRLRAVEWRHGEVNDWMLANKNFVTVPSDASTFTQIPVTFRGTSNPDMYGAAFIAGVDAVAILLPGTYSLELSFEFSGTYTGGAGKWCEAYAETFTGCFTANFDGGTGRVPLVDDTSPRHGSSLTKYWPTSGQPANVSVQARQNSGSDLTVNVELWIQLVNEYMITAEDCSVFQA